MQLNMEQQCRSNCFAISFDQVPDRGSGGKFRYSLSSNQMRISPRKRFVNDEEINHQKGAFYICPLFPFNEPALSSILLYQMMTITFVPVS